MTWDDFAKMYRPPDYCIRVGTCEIEGTPFGPFVVEDFLSQIGDDLPDDSYFAPAYDLYRVHPLDRFAWQCGRVIRYCYSRNDGGYSDHPGYFPERRYV